MIDKILKGIFSMKMMVIGMLTFAVSIAIATFIESDYGTPASKIAVYNSVWFQILLIYLGVILIVNIVKYKMYRREKIPTFLFHVAFLIILIGAGLTRYLGFEGQMRVPVGESTNIVWSRSPYLVLQANDLVNQYTHKDLRWMSEGVENPFSFEFQLPNQNKINVEYVSYKENMMDTLVESPNGKNALQFVIAGKDKFVFQGERGMLGNKLFSFSKEKSQLRGVRVFEENGDLMLTSSYPVVEVNMTSLSKENRRTGEIPPEAKTIIPRDTIVPFIPFRLYKFGETSVMFKAYRKGVVKKKVKAAEKDAGVDYLTLKLSTDTMEQIVHIPGGESMMIQKQYLNFAGINFEVGYGSIPIEIPFYIKCRKFDLDHYPGSSMASSFASEVTVIDSVRDVRHDQRIFMNNVMDYHGYRFFQSSYFADESGTVLSVNYDWWGTMVTYIGYFMMGLFMFFTVINPKGRIRELGNIVRKSRKNRTNMLKILALIVGLGWGGNALYAAAPDTLQNQGNKEEQITKDSLANAGAIVTKDSLSSAVETKEEATHPEIDLEAKFLSKENAAKLNDLLVQDYNGRIIPFNTLAYKLMRKISRKDHYNGKNAMQTILSMHLYGSKGWSDKKIIYVSHKIRDRINTGRYVSVNEIESENGNFKWLKEYQEAYAKADANKSQFDKEIINLGDRYRVMKEIFNFEYFRVIPVPGDDNGTWTWPFSHELQHKEDQTGNIVAMSLLRNLFLVSQGEEDMSEAVPFLTSLKESQWKAVNHYEITHPLIHKTTPQKVKVEILYNKLNIFDNIQSSYFLFGIALLILFFFRTLLKPTLKRESILKKISYVFLAGVLITFISHGVGLGMRWYITGHAPWSDGYEAVIFIAWATILAGLFFVKKNPAVIAATTLLAGVMLFVTQLNMLNPQLTPLEPVLKSYWLMIHVAVITSSYGFLGISAVLGIVNLFLYLCKTEKNKKRLQMNITELTSVGESVMIVGLFMLTIGTFLGGVWANESWGRYWGWDPKEVWALVSVLVYAIIIHVRWVPKLNNKFLFNVLSIWGYSAILFTFFGVNFILVGLHSYAQGEGVAELPTSAIVAIVLFVVFTIGAAIKYWMDKKKLKPKKG